MSQAQQSGPQPTPDEIYRLIRETAYLKAEARNFAPGVELQDWLEAEKEVLERLRISRNGEK